MKKSFPIIFICGLGGTGKSTLADNLKKSFSCETNIVRLDWYLIYPTEERKSRIRKALDSKDEQTIEKEENPLNWNDFHKLKKDLIYLQEHSSLDIQSAWNQKTGFKDTDIHLQFNESKGMIICEGIYLLHPEITDIADFIIHLDLSHNAASERGQQRDSHRSSKEYLEYKAKLQKKYDIPYFEKFINSADITITLDKDSYVGMKQIEEIRYKIANKLNLPS